MLRVKQTQQYEELPDSPLKTWEVFAVS